MALLLYLSSLRFRQFVWRIRCCCFGSSLFFFSDLSWFSLPQRLFFFVLTLCQAMSLCCFDFSFASCPQNATGWLALCCLSKQRIASPHLTAKEQRQSNGTKQYRNPEDWECSGRPQWIPSCILRSILDASPRLFQWGMHTRLPIAPCKFLNLRGWFVTVLCCMPHTPLPCQGETWHTTWSPRCKTSRKKKQERSIRKQKVAEGGRRCHWCQGKLLRHKHFAAVPVRQSTCCCSRTFQFS